MEFRAFTKVVVKEGKSDLTRQEKVFWDIAALFSVVLAFSIFAGSLPHLVLPGDVNLLRDTGQAQAILDGRFLDDHTYLNEKVWYNPLVPSIVAFISLLSGVPVHLLYSKAGMFLNLLAPFGLYVFMAYFFNRRVAFAGLISFLFLFSNQLPAWAIASYSPMLFASHFVQGLFYLSLVVFSKALNTGSTRWHLFAGAMLGVVFLGHTAPAIILGLIMLVDAIWSAIRSKLKADSNSSPGLYMRNFCVSIATAFLISLPYSYSILFHYKLGIKNRAPVDWQGGLLRIANIKQFFTTVLPPPVLLIIVAVGLVVLVLYRKRSIVKRISLSWFLISVFLLAYCFIAQLLSDKTALPAFVPAHHFLLYLISFLSLLFGLGATQIARLIAEFGRYLIRRLGVGAKTDSIHRYIQRAAVFLIPLLILLFSYDLYLQRSDMKHLRKSVAKKGRVAENYQKTVEWLTSHTQPDDVFLCDEEESLKIISPSGRKSVAIKPEFSNPYADYKERRSDNSLMYLALKHGENELFNRLQQKYRVAYILANPEVHEVEWGAPSFFKEVFTSETFTIYRITERGALRLPEKRLPYKAFLKARRLPHTAVLSMSKEHFNPLEKTDIAAVSERWSWVEEPPEDTELHRRLTEMEADGAVIMSRKMLIEFLQSPEAAELGKKRRLIFCNFSQPEGRVKLRALYPAKVIICREGSEFHGRLRATSADIYPIDAIEKLPDWNEPDDERFLQSLCRLIFNTAMEKKWAVRGARRIGKGKETRADAFRSLLSQAKTLHY